MTFTRALSTNNYGPAKFIVDGTTVANGTHSTIAAALAVASSGDTIVIRPGTYTENITLVAGVNLCALSDSWSPTGTSNTVTILGKVTASYAGLAHITGIELRTNADYCIELTGASATKLVLVNCFINATNNGAINHTGSSGLSIIYFNYCQGLINTPASYFTLTTAGSIYFNYSRFLDITSASNASTLAGTCGLFCYWSQFESGIANSSTSTITISNSMIRGRSTVVPIAITSTTPASSIKNSIIESAGSDSAITIGAGAALLLVNSEINSNNANTITGAGSITFGSLTFTGTSSQINVTTQTILSEGPQRTIGSSNSGATNTFLLQNTSNTASSNALEQISVAGTSAGDPFITYTVSGTTNWSVGIDNSVSDNYVIAASNTLGTTNVVSMTTAGAVSYVLGNVDVTRSASGATVSETISNTSNTASSNAQLQVTTAGTSAGDAFATFTVSGTTNWSIGTDNSVTGDPFVIAASTALGTTNVMSMTTAGEITQPLQPAFLGFLGTTATNKTGTGTTYTLGADALTEVFDQGGDFTTAGVFTAPVTGKYQLAGSAFLIGTTIMTINLVTMVTSNRNFKIQVGRTAVSADLGANISMLCDMDAADTYTCTVQGFGEAADTDDVSGATAFGTFMSGFLAC